MLRLLLPRGQYSSTLSGTHKLSTKSPAVPLDVQKLLADNNILMSQIPGAGRGLVAARAIGMGTCMFTERPYICHPRLANLDRVCSHCLAVLGRGGGMHTAGCGYPFCSRSCLEAAEATHLKVEVDGCFQALRDHCKAVNLMFPLLVQRVAISTLGAGLPWTQAVQDLNFLSYASIPEPTPQPFLEAYRLLCQGLQQYRRTKPGIYKSGDSGPSLAWFLGILSRLQINVFRVDCIFPLEGSLQTRAAAVISGQTDQGASGSALYRAAALFNHHCAPNVAVNFPHNDGEVNFTAEQSIAEGEELCISYLDTTLPLKERQQQLFLGYGFKCSCSRCQEEA